jgi:hypothetical protein
MTEHATAEEVRGMGFKKFGTGEITETEGQTAKTAAKQDWTDEDNQALARENAAADQEVQ